jgi:hypothetical protein
VVDAGSFVVQTWATISGTDYQIDEQTFTNVYTPKAEELTATISDVSSYVTSAYTTTYQIELTPKKTIPAGGKFVVTFPAEIELADGVSSISPCSVVMGGVTTTLSGCTYTTSSG